MASNKVIAKNTIMMYVRMICSVLINLYASRVILGALGVEDFGIYNLVAGIVTMLGFLNTTMSGCTSRFLTYELGRGDIESLKKTFSTALLIHLSIALIVLILGETLGLWLINTQLVIPINKMPSVNYLYQFSLLATVVSFIQVPYSAEVIAHERIGVYALIEILKVALKLGASFIVAYTAIDRLITYSLLLFIASIIVFLIYLFYCRKQFEEIYFSSHINKEVLLPMLKFTGWDLYGNASVILQQQGTNILINRYFGAVLNAATGVATQASSAVSMFVTSFTMALRPPIIKKYAVGDIDALQKLLLISIVLCAFLAEMICLPLYLRIDYLMQLWLKDVPPYATDFCRWMLLANSIGIINSLFTTLIHATGKIRRLSLLSGSLYLSAVLFSYFAFRFLGTPVLAYVILFNIMITVLLSNIIIAKKQIPQLAWLQLLKSLILPLIILFIVIIVSSYINNLLPVNLWGVLMLFVLNAVISIVLLYTVWIGPKYGWNLRSLVIYES